jgi:hypothetical protein
VLFQLLQKKPVGQSSKVPFTQFPASAVATDGVQL